MLFRSQVAPAAGLTFSNGLRSILRHDPDIILVGEIRDKETAEVAVHASLTGHVVLSSLHTNSAIGAIPRLLDLGVQPYLIGSSLSLIIAQRLVAKNDQNCLVSAPINTDMIVSIEKEFGVSVPKSFTAKPKQYKGKGCSSCNNEGFKGRIGIFEVLRISEKIRDLIFTKAPIGEIEKQAKVEGFRSMLEDGLDKVQAGLTTLEEILRAVRE